jgi:CubicO group peptidase (beta-lactamase class C family)
MLRFSSAALLATGLLLVPALPAQQPDSLAPALERYLTGRVASDSFSGVVLVARNGVPVFRRAYGFSLAEARIPNSPDMRFNLGSLDKLLTRIAVWQLVAAGKLSLDAPVGRYLPGYPNRAVRERVTARQLYSMRSGVGNFWNAEYLRRHVEIRTVDDYLALFATDSLLFEPGSRIAYSNGGYIILGKLIEQLSGLSYPDYVARHVTGPAGMDATGPIPLDEPTGLVAIGYTTQDSAGGSTPARRPNLWSLAGLGSAAGGGFSTVDDFLKLDAALRAGRLLPPAFADSVLAPGFRSGGSEPVQYGGGGPGVNTQYVAFPDGWTVIVFSNYDPPAATSVLQQIAALLGKTVAGGRAVRRPG